MSNPTHADYLAMLSRCERNRLRDTPPPDDAVELESPLQDEIRRVCEGNRWPYHWSRMDKKTRTKKGLADFVIFRAGKVYAIECKTRTGKRTPEQLAYALLMEREGFTVHIVRSMSEFWEAMEA